MRKTLTTVALLLALSCTVFGGEMSTPPAPPPQPATVVQEPTDTDQEPAGSEMPNGVSDILTETALDLLALLPSLL
jgi:hypothetical protein